MATKFWLGANTDWNDTTNWSATDGGASGAAAPVNTNDVYIKQGSKMPLLNLNQSAVTVNSLSIFPGAGSDVAGLTIGTDSTSLQINVTTTLYIENTRLSYIKINGTIATIDCRSFGQGKLFVSGGAVTNFYGGESGRFEIEDDVELTEFYTAGMSGIIKGDATSPVDLLMGIGSGANVECWRKIHTADVDGVLTCRYAAEGSASSGTSKWRVHRGGRLYIWSSGNIANLETFPGSLASAVDSPGYGTLPTIAALRKHSRSETLFPTAKITVTATTPIGNVTGGNLGA